MEVINGGGATLQAILAQVAMAQLHVHLEYYILEPDQSGVQLIDALIAALRRGVKVRLLVDDVGSSASWAVPGGSCGNASWRLAVSWPLSTPFVSVCSCGPC